MIRQAIRFGNLLHGGPRVLAMAIALLVVSVPVHAQGRQKVNPPVSFEPSSLDLGYAGFGVDLVGTVMVRNNSQRPLRINRTRADCNCTVPSISSEHLMPGEAVELTVAVETGWIPGPVKKHVYMSIDGYTAPLTLPVMAELSYAVKSTPLNIAQAGELNGELSLASIDGAAFEVLSVNGQPPAWPDGETGGAAAEHRILWELDPENIPVWLVIETSHPDAPVIEIRVKHPDVAGEVAQLRKGNPAAPVISNLNFGFLEPGKPEEFRVEFQRVNWGEPLEVLNESDRVTVEIIHREKAKAGGTRVQLRVTANEGIEPGVINEPVLFLNGENMGRLWVIGKVPSN